MKNNISTGVNMETSDNELIIPSLKTLVEIYSKDRYNFTNTGLIEFMATLEKNVI